MLENKTSFAVLIIAITLALMTGFQMRQVLADRDAIQEAFEGQTKPLEQAKQVGAQFESIAVGTAKLAGEGNVTAQAVIKQLKDIGVNVNPNATPGQKGIEFKAPQAPQQNITTPPAPATTPAPAAVGN
jgi:hypothetical protein